MSDVNEWSAVEDGNTHLDQFDLQQRINPHSPLNRYTKKIMAAVRAKADAMQAEIDTLAPMGGVVHITGDETVGGVKTFQEPIVGDVSAAVSVPEGVTPTPRLLTERFADVVNVKDFGAVGGSLDTSEAVAANTAAIQAALDAVSEFGAVFFPPNEKFVTGPLLIKRPMTLLNGHLYFASGGLLYDQSVNHGGYFFMDNMVLESSGTDANAIGLQLKGAYKNRITNSTFLNFSNAGIRVDGGNETNISHCKIRRTVGFGGSGLIYTGSDNLASDIDIQGYKLAIYNGGHNFYCNVHAWTMTTTNPLYTKTNLENSTFMHVNFGRVVCVNMYIDTFHRGFEFSAGAPYTDVALSNILVLTAFGALDGNTGEYDLVSLIFFLSGASDSDKLSQLRNIKISGLLSIRKDSGLDVDFYPFIQFSNIGSSFYLPCFYENNNAECRRFKKAPSFAIVNPNLLSSTSAYNIWASSSVVDDANKLRGALTIRSFNDASNNTQLQLYAYSGGSSTKSGGLYINSESGSGGFLKLLLDSSHVYPSGTTGTIDLGKSDARWNNVFCVTTNASSSDATLKEDIAPIDNILLDAWSGVEWAQFKFSDAVSSKGSKARLHAGAIAQQIAEAFSKNGLDASKYGLFCYDEWEESVEEEVFVDKEAVIEERVVVDKEAVVKKRVVQDYPSWSDEHGVVHDPIVHEEEEIIEPEQFHIEKIVVEPEKTHTVKHVRPAGSVYSLRYVEALVVEAAYQRRRADRLEARIASLEEKIYGSK